MHFKKKTNFVMKKLNCMEVNLIVLKKLGNGKAPKKFQEPT